jgi:Domain of unknown function (DUF4148)
MNTFAKLLTVAAIVAAPVAAYAQQSNGPVTRAQVYDQLVQLEKAGYQPGGESAINYPAGIQAAEARVAAQDGQQTAVGGVEGGSSAAGAPVARAPISGPGSIYFGQ